MSGYFLELFPDISAFLTVQRRRSVGTGIKRLFTSVKKETGKPGHK
jgi:hypothetical protein